MIFNGNYFQNNPERILGVWTTHNPNTGRELTDAYGKPRPEVWGTLADALARIDAPAVQRYSHFQAAGAVALNARLEQSLQQSVQDAAAAPAASRKPGDYQTLSLEESIRKFNTGVEYKLPDGSRTTYNIPEEEIRVFVTYQVQNGLWDAKTIRGNAWGRYLGDDATMRGAFPQYSAYDGQKWVPASIYYAGNIYQRVQEARERRAAIVAEVGEAGFEQQLAGLEAVRPAMLRFNKDPNKSLYISPFDRIWGEFKFEQDTDGVPFDEPVSAIETFKRWLRQLPPSDFSIQGGQVVSNERDVIAYWLNGSQFPRSSNLTDEQKAAIKRDSALVGDVLFQRFCVDGIPRDLQVRIEYLFNSSRNHYTPVQYHRIPVGFEINTRFKGSAFEVRSAQREGVAFCAERGTGLIAFDVGVGKTPTAILSIEDGFSKGLFRRPLAVTPNGVYWKWVAEIEGIHAEKDFERGGKKYKKGDLLAEGVLPHRQVNAYYNLGAEVTVPMSGNRAATVPEGSITVLTFEGLEKLGFRQENEKGLVDRVRQALSQSEGGRADAIKEKSAETWLDKALAKTEYNFEDFGFDSIVVDECHNFRNLFVEVKGDIDEKGNREDKRFFSSNGGQPSTRAIKLFLLNLLVQSKHGGRNTIGLSATPFTNRPTEVFSMLSLFDSQGLQDFDVSNLARFCATFLDETSEPVWTAKGTFENKYVVRGWNNLTVLQSLLFKSINYKSGEDAQIRRPEKVVLPLLRDERGLPLPPQYIVETRLPETPEQQRWMKASYEFAGDEWAVSEIQKLGQYEINEKTSKPNGQVLVALNAARNATFSPYTLNFKGNSPFDNLNSLTPDELIASSPKLEYTMGCIQSVRDWHRSKSTPMSGQIIYSNSGTGFFPLIKEYLVKELGFADSEVAILTGETPQTQRERIKKGFLDNSIKILIGSSAIREGMDLQTYCTCIYVLYIDWNPTDLHQLFGRGWRFGNLFSHVRMVIPLVENTSDIFTWQKLSEKMSRLNSLWERTGSNKMFEEGEINPDELKRGLITDPRELTRFQIQGEEALVKSRLITLDAELSEVRDAKKAYNVIKSLEQTLLEGVNSVDKYEPAEWWVQYNKDKAKRLADIKAMPADFADIKTVYQKIRAMVRFASNNSLSPYLYLGDYGRSIDEHIKAVKAITRVQQSVLAAYRLPLDRLDEVEGLIEEKRVAASLEIERLNSTDYFKEVLAEVTAQKEAQAATRRTIDERVREFSRLNYLLDCKFEVDACDLYGRAESDTQALQPAPARTTATAGSGSAVTDAAAEIGEAIQALTAALKFTTGKKDKKEITEAIVALKAAQAFV